MTLGAVSGDGFPIRTDETRAERGARARTLRRQVPRGDHAEWRPAADRADVAATVTAQETGRLPWLIPVRRERMAESPFAFFRGTAGIMAADLACTPVTGVQVQLCGDAHLANFGTFASPERRQVFDVNDFDETLPGPWEWDVKRLAASFVLAARDNGLDGALGERIARRAVTAYRRAVRGFAASPALEVWYAQASLDALEGRMPTKADRRRLSRAGGRARRRTSQRVLTRLGETIDGRLRIRSDPPLLIPLRDLAGETDPERLRRIVDESFVSYLRSLPPDRRSLLYRFRPVDLALKAVGVGSVGTRCLVLLLQGRDHGEPLFLQIKEAGDSALAAHLPGADRRPAGQRVVEGQRLLQTASDIFLGWSETTTGGLHFYWRQLHDMKGSVDVGALTPPTMAAYADLCGWTLAHGHARSGDAVAIAAYLGSGDVFDVAVGRFAVTYADQVERDHSLFLAACGRPGQDRAEVGGP